MNSKINKRLLSLRQKMQNRRGFTILEVALTLALSSVLLYGMVVLVLQFKEVIWINMQLRNAEEFAMDYIYTFTKHMKNGYSAEIVNQSWPSRARVWYIDPDDATLSKDLYDFRRDPNTGLPTVYVNNRRVRQQDFPPVGDGRDNFVVDARTFRIYYNEIDPGRTPEKWNESYITLSFSMTYTREPIFPYRNRYEKRMDFQGSAFVYNDNWPSNDDLRFPTRDLWGQGE
ncbi:prepilin-type N-terminal cleavage/methylation domain-containing protein [bacterium]|nr:prepilin-type N-terminal cleavage/methylation domain-containing protein [bacterium]